MDRQEWVHLIVNHPGTVNLADRLSQIIVAMGQVGSACELPLDSARSSLPHPPRRMPSGYAVVREAEQVIGVLTAQEVVCWLLTQWLSEGSSREGLSGEDWRLSRVLTGSIVPLLESELTDQIAAIQLLQQRKMSCLPVVDAQDQFIGLLTAESLARFSQPLAPLRLQTVADVMQTVTVTVDSDCLVGAIAQQMTAQNASILVRSVDEATLLANPGLQQTWGIIQAQDIVQLLALGVDLNRVRASTIMQAIATISPGETLWSAYQHIDRQGGYPLAVMSGPGNSGLGDSGAEHLVGLLSLDDVLRAFDPLMLYRLSETWVAKLDASEAVASTPQAAPANQPPAAEELPTAPIERSQGTQALLQLNQELERRVEERTADLQASEERWQLALKGTNDGIWDWNPQTKQLFLSQRLKEMHGYGDDELPETPEDWMDLVHPDDRDRLHQAVADHLAGETEFFQLEYRVLHKNGSYIWVLNRAQAQWDENGQAVRLIGSESDITQRKQAELALQESEKLYAMMADASPVAICRFDAPMNCVYVSDRWSEMTGRPLEEALGQGWVEAIHPDDRDRLLAPWNNSAAEIEMVPPVAMQGIEARHLRPDGSINWFYVQARPEFDDQGQICGCISTLTDITRLKQVEAELAASEAKYRQLVEGGQDIVWSIDIEDRFTYLSPQFQSLCGWEPSEWIGRKSIEIVYPEDQDWLIQQRSLSTVNAAQSYLEFRHRHRDRPYVWVRVSTTPIFDPDGQIVGYQGTVANITDRKAIELALQESERRYASLAAAAPVAIFRMDQQPLNCVYVNERWSAMTGRPVEAALGQGWIEALHPDDRERRVAEWLQAVDIHNPRLADGLTLPPAEGRHLRPDGTVNWYYVQVARELDEYGNVVGYVGTLTDITERKAAEKSLSLTQFAVDKTALGVFWIREDGLFLEVNESACAGLGYTYEELKGRYVWEINPELQPEEWPSYWQDLKQNSFIRFDVNHQHKDGRIFPVEIISNYLEYEGQGFAFAQVQDISDRRRSEQQLQEVSERLALAIKSAQLGIWEYDFGSGRLTWNDRMFAIYGVQPENFNSTHRDWEKCVHPDDLAQALPDLMDDENYFAKEFRIVHPDGSIRHIFSSALRQRDQQGQLIRCVGVNLDITDRKQAEARLQQTNEELIRATRLKDEFLANMSHELRTPLNAILGMSETLQEQILGTLNEQQMRMLHIIERSGEHLLALINDILDVAKIESGQVTLETVPVNIALLCQASLTFVQQQALKKNIQLEIQLPPSPLPDLYLDNRRIRQVFINLLNNAVKFTPDGGQVTLKVVAPWEWQDVNDPLSLTNPLLQVSVTDTGIGIAPENIPKLFQPFFQIDSALNRQYEGTGLGLALVKRIVELHGGEVHLTSELGVGSCFTVTLPYRPLQTVDITNLPQPIADQNLSGDITEKPGIKIVLAEDNEDNITMIVDYLKAMGHSLFIARNGQEAIALTQALHPDLVLMDIQMPGMDGLEAISQIRQIPEFRNLPIIALTALAMPDDEARCLAAGATGYLSKPVRLKNLHAKIQSCLGA